MLDAFTLDQIRNFIAVAEAGSFRAAARKLSRVQSAVSNAVANMEAQLGVPLFDRSTHRPTLTREGKAVLSDARAVLLKVDGLRARARGMGEGLEMSLSIAVDSLFPLEMLAMALKDLHDTCPSVAVRTWVGPLGGPLAALSDGRCTFGIKVGGGIRDPRLEFEVMSRVPPLVAVVAPSSPLGLRAGLKELVATSELADHVQIVVEDPSTLTEGRDLGVLSQVTWRVSDMAAKRAYILAGIGWGSLPLWLIERDLTEGRLIRVAAAEFGAAGETQMRAYLARRTDQALGPAAQLLRQALLRRVASG